MTRYFSVFSIAVLAWIVSAGDSFATDYAEISGVVEYHGAPVCGLVLANGVPMFSCSGDGRFSLTAPLDENGKVTLFSFVSGLAPFQQEFNPETLTNYTINMSVAGSEPALAVNYATGASSQTGRVSLSGTVDINGTPVCGLVLANGQYMFSCGTEMGRFTLDVPLDESGRMTLFVFASGFQPFSVTFAPDGGEGATGGWYKPAVGMSWQLQLTGTVNPDYPVELYDLDLFDTSESEIAQLQADGKHVICYFSAGSYEDWRSDAGEFPANILGNGLDGWAGEWWLDIRSETVRLIMQNRLDMARRKGCDGVDPDNVNGFVNNTGFNLTAADQLTFNQFIATEAHQRNLAIGLKNDIQQADQLVDFFDFMVNEQCFAYDECDLLASFIENGKPVFNVEYADKYVNKPKIRQALCADAAQRQFSTLVLPLDLDDSFRYSCF